MRRPVKPSFLRVVPNPVEVTLVWKDKSRCQATVPRLAPEVTCGDHRFRQDAEHENIYIEV